MLCSRVWSSSCLFGSKRGSPAGCEPAALRRPSHGNLHCMQQSLVRCQADEMLALVLQDIKFNVHAHPTLSEVLDELFKGAHIDKAPSKVVRSPPLPCNEGCCSLTGIQGAFLRVLQQIYGWEFHICCCLQQIAFSAEKVKTPVTV